MYHDKRNDGGKAVSEDAGGKPTIPCGAAGQTADDIIAHADEIACRDNFLMIFEDETGLKPQQLNALLRFEHPLAELYDDWIKRETSEMDNCRSSIECCANDAIRRDKERKARKKDAPER